MMRWRAATLLLALASSLGAASITVGSTSVTVGHSANLSIVLSAQGAQITGLGFELRYDTANLTISISAGASSVAAGKNVAVNNTANGQSVLIAGLNQTTIGDGSVADLSITVSANAPPANYPLTLFNVSATDKNGNPISLSGNSGTLTVLAPLLVTGPNSLPVATMNVPFTATTVTASGGSGGYSWAATGLPAGLTIDQTTGNIAGTPTTNNGSPFSVQVTVTDSNTSTASKTYSLTVNPALLLSGPAALPAGTVNALYSTSAGTPSGGNGSYTWSATGLPTGLSIGLNSGRISGTPAVNTNAASPYTVQVTVTDGNQVTANHSYSLTINGPLSVTGPASLPVGTAGALYPNTTVAASGGSGIYEWSATGLPGGLSISAGQGTISGTPIANSNNSSPYTVQVTVTDSNSVTASQSYSMTVNPALVISGPAALPTATLTVVYTNTTVTATGGNGSYTWSATGLPPGLGIDPVSGKISGTPTSSAGSPLTVQVTVTDGNQVATIRSYSLTVNNALTVPSPATLPVGTVNSLYPSTTIVAAGGSGSYTWLATGLPPGLGIDAVSGKISGTPTGNAGSPFAVQVTVTDSNQVATTRSYSLTINNALTVTGPGALPVGTVNATYVSTTVSAAGGSGSYAWSSTGLPAGLSLNSATGAITGTPAASNGSPFTVLVTVTDSNSVTASQSYQLTVNPALLVSGPASLAVGEVNATYPGTTATASGGSGTYSWSATGLPAGITIDPTSGTIAGTPTSNNGSPFNVTVTVSDTNTVTASRSYQLTINGQLLISGPAVLPVGTVSSVYSLTTVTATGGIGSFTWSATGLPAGLSIDPQLGTLSGTPSTNAGSPFSVTVKVTDTHGGLSVAPYSVTVNPALTISAPAALVAGSVNGVYPITMVTAAGGSGTYTFSATGLPPGMSINSSTGAISGTPTTNVGSPFNVQVKATDSNLVTATRTYALVVNGPLVVSTPASLPVGTAGTPYPVTTIMAAGGTAPFTWTATGLPAGLNLAPATGILSGTPASSTVSPLTVTVTVTDANLTAANRPYSLTVNPALSIAGSSSLPVATAGAVYPAPTITASGGSGVYTWSATGLPAGLSIGATTGAISGTPSTNSGSPFTVQVTATDSNLVTASRSYVLTVNPALIISGPSGLPLGIVNVVYPGATFTATGGNGTYSWSAIGLPAGLSVAAATGALSGKPTTFNFNPFNVQVTVTDGNGVASGRNYLLTINGPLTVSGPISLPAGSVNAVYSFTGVTATGGSGNYSFSATGLPAGLSINSATGEIHGAPTSSAGNPFNVVVTVTDTNSGTANSAFLLVINSEFTLTVSGPASLPPATANLLYSSTTIAATGGTGAYSWSATGLPAGLSIGTASGTIAGTPTTNAGSPYSVKVTVTDADSATASRTYSLTVNGPLTVSGPAALPGGTVGTKYADQTVSATGGSGAYTWTATGLAPGLSINSATGTISGTPTSNTGSPFTVTVTVTDGGGATATRIFALAINSASSALPLISSVSNAANGQPGVAANSWISIYGANFAPAGFIDDWSNSIVNGQLPTVLDGVRVTIGGQPAYVFFVSSGQINVLSPDLGTGSMAVTVTTSAGISAPVTVTSLPYTPAFFPWPAGQPVATHVDFSYASKNGSFPGLATVPAKPGEVIILWGTGFGPTAPATPVGIQIPVTPTYYTATPVTVTFGGTPAAVYGTALASGFGGLFQVIVTVPPSLLDGDYAVLATVNGVPTPVATTLTIHK